MESYLIWYTCGAQNEKIPRIITAMSKDDAINRFSEIVKEWNEILSIEIHYIET